MHVCRLYALADSDSDQPNAELFVTMGYPTRRSCLVSTCPLAATDLKILRIPKRSPRQIVTMPSANHAFAACIIALSTAIASAEDGATKGAFLKTYCVKCHGADLHKGDVRLDQLALPLTIENQELWTEVIHNLQRGDMPPKDARQPTDTQRQAFLAEVVPNLEKHAAESIATSDPLVRLTNNQIAHSLQDLLQTHEHIADQLIGDPVDKHGFSRQVELDLSGSYLQLYAGALEQIIERAMPNIEPTRPDVFRITGNDWEKCHWAGDNYLYQGYRRLYEGPKWIGDDFEIPIPPKHEYRMFLRENRSKGRFRIRLTLRNEPPANGQPPTPQEIGVYMDQAGDHPYKLVEPITVP